MKILVGIPCLYGYGHTKAAVESLLNQRNVDVLLVDNGAELEIKNLFKTYTPLPNVKIIENQTNIYVNPAWNQILKHFLFESDAEHLVIMNSDLVLQKDWSEILRNRVKHFNNETIVPTLLKDNRHVSQAVDINRLDHQTVQSAAGFFITLSRSQAHMVYPITEECKVWYGDNWIYCILQGAGHSIVIPDNLKAHHGLSQTIQRVAGVTEIIAKDTETWNNIVSLKVLKIIEENKSR